MSGKLLDQTFQSNEELIYVLTSDFFPNAHIFQNEEPVKGKEKYTWSGQVVLCYYNEYYCISYTCVGNGSWTSFFELHDYNVTSISKVKVVTREVKVTRHELHFIENVDC